MESTRVFSCSIDSMKSLPKSIDQYFQHLLKTTKHYFGNVGFWKKKNQNTHAHTHTHTQHAKSYICICLQHILCTLGKIFHPSHDASWRSLIKAFDPLYRQTSAWTRHSHRRGQGIPSYPTYPWKIPKRPHRPSSLCFGIPENHLGGLGMPFWVRWLRVFFFHQIVQSSGSSGSQIFEHSLNVFKDTLRPSTNSE